ncbi:hypothetical protein Mpt1_c06340 [Candidatus Methanoplasma termitum]|uniref:Bacterial membrane flanked domain protein n=1 Tax=Candidatus Methanoplasma termitum TaxID=1577791 RepID=A0A0A7LBJ3_9ARCH|nr:hypothetical protein [Candidatus Methanoplasma termitum]AIZ56520.1 hypothetical protein Mpt1_c06340 [Candidatus Methanoplasma termitum]MCL2334195.1 hypothetical protein [Candidatus Methanoplasma sp.]
MTKTFEEVQDLIPKKEFFILTAVLISTSIFIFICTFVESLNMPVWAFPITTVTFAAIIIFCFFVKLKISIEGEVISIMFIKSYAIKFEEIIDYKVGDLNIMRNYSGWGIKKVTFRNLVCFGYDSGISLKLTGRKVMTISLSNPEQFASLLPVPQQS